MRKRIPPECNVLSLDDAAALVGQLPKDSPGRKLFDAIKSIRSAKDLSFLQLSYRYGDIIADSGTFLLDDPHIRISPEIRKAYSAHAIPMGICLHRPIEVFKWVEASESRGHCLRGASKSAQLRHPRPIRVLAPGEVFGLFEFLDALDGRPLKADYSLAAGLISLCFGVPFGSVEAIASLQELNSSMTWQPFEPPFQLVQELSSATDWRASVLLIPDIIFTGAFAQPKLESLLFRLALRQSANQRLDLYVRDIVRSEQGHVSEANGLFIDQILHVLGIIRGDSPAMVPWQQAQQAAVPLENVLDSLRTFVKKRPTRRGSPPYHTYVMVPKHLDSDERGFFSCRTNNGPVDTKHWKKVNPAIQTKVLHDALEAVLPSVLNVPSSTVKEIVRPFLFPSRYTTKTVPGFKAFLDRCRPLTVAEIDCEGTQQTSETSLWEEGFANAGLSIWRPR